MVYGVDGCRGPGAGGTAWVVVALEERGAFGTAAVVESFAGVVERTHDGDLVLVDIPIGLPDADRPTRACDREARRAIGERRSSVFAAPARSALGARCYQEASEENRRAIGRGLSQQAWGICPRIADVDALLRQQTDLRPRYRESHPELCFTALNGWRPPRCRKRDAEGRAERLQILARYGANASAWLEHTRSQWPRSVLDVTDLLDAMALAVTASHALARGCPTLPPEPPVDAEGLRMEMVCPSAAAR